MLCLEIVKVLPAEFSAIIPTEAVAAAAGEVEDEVEGSEEELDWLVEGDEEEGAGEGCRGQPMRGAKPAPPYIFPRCGLDS